MNCRLRFGWMILPISFAWAVMPGGSFAQKAKVPDEKLVLQVYQVADMLMPTRDYEYHGERLPTTGENNPWGRFDASGVGGGMGGGGMGGGVDGGGGGMFSVLSSSGKPQHSASSAFDINGLIEVITCQIAPESWDVDGGLVASINAMGTLIFVRQTPAAHQEIGELLDTIRREGGRLCSVTVEAWWLLLDSDQLNELYGTEVNAHHPIIRSELERLAREETSYRGRITCFSGQRVFIVAGRRQNILYSGIPVVGSEVGYQAISVVPNIGILLQVRPTLLPHERAAILDVHSTVTDWQDGEETDRRPDGRGPRASSILLPSDPTSAALGPNVPIDRVNIKAQELATTLRVPLGEPVLVGGLTLVPMKQTARELGASQTNSTESRTREGLVKKLTKRREREQLYIVIEVTAELRPAEKENSK